MSRAVLLSGSLGMGHDVMAEACASSLGDHGWSSETLDAMLLLGKRGGAAGELVFRTLLSVPGLYDAFHFSGLRAGGAGPARRQRRPPAGGTPAPGSPRREPRPAGHLGVRHRRLGDEQPDGPVPGHKHVVFCTDAVPHRLWVHPNTDLYLVTSAAAEPYVHRFQPEARVMVVPAVVRAPFYQPPTQTGRPRRAGGAAERPVRPADVGGLGTGAGRRSGGSAG